eukprot:m51a1_g11192 hypothetical protein (881) ;mRNA; r:35475-39794
MSAGRKRKWDVPGDPALAAQQLQRLESPPAASGSRVPQSAAEVSAIAAALIAQQRAAAPASHAAAAAAAQAAVAAAAEAARRLSQGPLQQQQQQQHGGHGGHGGQPQLQERRTRGDEEEVRDITINECRADIRFVLTKGTTHDEIFRQTGATLCARGRYRAPGSHAAGPSEAEPPLYIRITAETPEQIELAAARVYSIMGVAPPLPQQGAPQPQLQQQQQQQQQQAEQQHSAKVPLGLESPHADFNAAQQIIGPRGSFLKHIATETGATVLVRGRGSGVLEPGTSHEAPEPLFLLVQAPSREALDAAKGLAESLLQHVRDEYDKFMKARPPPPPAPAAAAPAQVAAAQPPAAAQGAPVQQQRAGQGQGQGSPAAAKASQSPPRGTPPMPYAMPPMMPGMMPGMPGMPPMPYAPPYGMPYGYPPMPMCPYPPDPAAMAAMQAPSWRRLEEALHCILQVCRERPSLVRLALASATSIHQGVLDVAWALAAALALSRLVLPGLGGSSGSSSPTIALGTGTPGSSSGSASDPSASPSPMSSPVFMPPGTHPAGATVGGALAGSFALGPSADSPECSLLRCPEPGAPLLAPQGLRSSVSVGPLGVAPQAPSPVAWRGVGPLCCSDSPRTSPREWAPGLLCASPPQGPLVHAARSAQPLTPSPVVATRIVLSASLPLDDDLAVPLPERAVSPMTLGPQLGYSASPPCSAATPLPPELILRSSTPDPTGAAAELGLLRVMQDLGARSSGLAPLGGGGGPSALAPTQSQLHVLHNASLGTRPRSGSMGGAVALRSGLQVPPAARLGSALSGSASKLALQQQAAGPGQRAPKAKAAAEQAGAQQAQGTPTLSQSQGHKPPSPVPNRSPERMRRKPQTVVSEVLVSDKQP